MSWVAKFKTWFNATFRGPVRKEQWAWAMYDWAKSPYENAVIGVFLGPFITGLSKQHSYIDFLCTVDTCTWCPLQASCLDSFNLTRCSLCRETSSWCCSETQGYVYIGESPISYGSIYAYSISASAVIQVIILPFIGAFGDSTNKPKFYLLLSTIAASIVLILMLTVDAPNLFWLATLFSILGNVLYAMINVFYNALLVFIASPKEQDNVSALGYAIGYIGGGIVLLASLLTYLDYPGYLTIRIMIAVCGVWWMTFSIITFKNVKSTTKRLDPEEDTSSPSSKYSSLDKSMPLPEIEPSADNNEDSNNNNENLPPMNQIVSTSLQEEEDAEKGGTVVKAFKQLWRTILVLRYIPVTALFLVAAAIYNDGISTVSSLAGTYSTEALNASFTTLAVLALVTNFSGVAGAFFFTWLAKKIGAKYAILLSLLLWCGVVIAQLYFIGFLIGVGLGSSQPLSRSFLANIIPKGFENQIFSFYELTQRGTSWIGPLIYASITDRYENNPRPGILAMLAFFVIGGILLFLVNPEKALIDAKLVEQGKKGKENKA